MGSNIIESRLAPFNIQKGNGVPSHIAPNGTLYFETISAVTYQNINGVNSWSLIGSGGGGGGGVTSPAGYDTYVQYNSSSNFGADNNFTWDYTNRNLSIGLNNSSINTSTQCFLVGGKNNQIINYLSTDPYTNFLNNSILGGESNQIYNSNGGSIQFLDNTIVGGMNNYIAEKNGVNGVEYNYNIILGGNGSGIQDNINSAILGGEANSITGTHNIQGINNTIIGGDTNQINNLNPSAQINNNVIIGGSSSIIAELYGHSNIYFNFIAGGQNNYIYDSEQSSIIGGMNNTIVLNQSTNSQYNSIVGGLNNSITESIGQDGITSINSNAIVGGYSNSILNAYGDYTNINNNFIGGSESSEIQNVLDSAIIAGSNNIIRNNSLYSGIIGGQYNTIGTGIQNSIILGGLSITATNNNFVYVPNLNVNTTPTNDDTLTQILVRDSVSGDIKYRNSSSIGGSGTFTGGTVNGATSFTNGLTASTISATTYQNLPTNITITGGTYSNNNFTFTNNTGGTFSINNVNTMTGLTINGALTVTGNTISNTFSGTSDTISGTKGSVITNGSSTTAFITVSGSNTIGGAGYTDFIRVTNNSAGATNATKTIRVNNTGGIEFLNSAYTAQTLTLGDNGILFIGGGNVATTSNNDATANYLNFGNNNSQIYDDGNFHIHSRNSGQSMWINTNGGQLNLLTQSPTSTGGIGSGIAIATTTLNGYVTINTGKSYTTSANYGYLTTGGAGTYPGGSQTVSISLYATARIWGQEIDAFSDERMKNIEGEVQLNDAIKLVNELKPIKYTWKESEDKGLKVGYSAQQVSKAGFDHLIGLVPREGLEETIDDDGFLSPKDTQFSMNYDQVTPYHGVVIKHLLNKIDDLQKQIDELKGN
jgi:hypothetical protein